MAHLLPDKPLFSDSHCNVHNMDKALLKNKDVEMVYNIHKFPHKCIYLEISDYTLNMIINE